MPLNDRQAEILGYLKKNKRLSVKKASEIFYVSEMTVRRDFKEMEKKGFIQRYNGGAVFSESGSLPLEFRKMLRSKEKKLLSSKAKEHIKDGMSVYIDSSSTCLYVLPQLAEHKDITVVTNSVQCLITASEYNLKCIIAGGNFYKYDMCTVGSKTDEFLSGMNTDVGFFCVEGISDDGIISDGDELQTSARKAAMKNCGKIIFLFDETRQHKKCLYTLCKAGDADDIIII